jgi:hypothetical protein
VYIHVACFAIRSRAKSSVGQVALRTALKRFEVIQLSGFGFGTAERGSLPEGVFKSAHRVDPP